MSTQKRRVGRDTYVLHDVAEQELDRHPEDWGPVDLALLCEREAHFAGWDSPLSTPQIFVLIAPPTGPGDQLLPAPTLSEVLWRLAVERYAGDAGAAIVYMGRNLVSARFEEIARVRPMLPVGRRIAGLAIRYEAWGIADEKDYVALGGRIEDHAERVEIRIIQMVMSTGTTYFMQRKRGHKPTVFVVRPESETGVVSGNMPRGLAMIYNAMADNPIPVPAVRMPRDE